MFSKVHFSQQMFLPCILRAFRRIAPFKSGVLVLTVLLRPWWSWKLGQILWIVVNKLFFHLPMLYVFLSKCENKCSRRRPSLSSFGTHDVLYYAGVLQDERLQTMTTIVWVRLVSNHGDHIAAKLKRIPQYSWKRVYNVEMMIRSS